MREEPWENYYEPAPCGCFPKRCLIPNVAIYKYFKNNNNWCQFPRFLSYLFKANGIK